MGYVVQHHPGDIGFIFPEIGYVDYPDGGEEDPLLLNLDGCPTTVKVHRYYSQKEDGGEVIYYMLRHRLFLSRMNKHEIYPDATDTVGGQRFYSLWNQCIGQLLCRNDYDIYHACDYHGALAFLYCHRPVRMVLTLHNAQYQGNFTNYILVLAK